MSVTKKTTTVTTTGDAKAKIIQAGKNTSQVGKQPMLPTEEEDGVIFNSVGQRVEKKTAEKGDAYYNPQGRIVIVQQEMDDQVFVGEIGTNAQWLPKEMVESWGKVPKGEAPKEEKEEKDENANDSRYGDSVAPAKEYEGEPVGEEEEDENGGKKKGKKKEEDEEEDEEGKKKSKQKKSEDESKEPSSY